MQNDITYLLSSFRNNPERLFQGYCFDKENFIFGQEGADKYFKETGREIAFGEDGCYVLAKKVEENYLLGSDCSGYKKILYFKDPNSEVWAVSNSINLLVEHLAENSIRVTPNISLLMMMSAGRSVSQQPITFNTIVNEIKILPLNTLLTIGSNTIKIDKLEESNNLSTDYSEMLLEFINIWISRFATLISCKDMLIQQGLTGGLDSRALFSISNHTYYNIANKESADYRLVSGLTRGDDTDLKIAKKIADYYGYEVNNKDAYSFTEKPLNNEEKYLGWKNICLGLYQPIYFPRTKIDYRNISIGGHGGENHRAFYAKSPKVDSYNDFIKSLCSQVAKPELKVDLAIDLYETLIQMQEADACGEDIDPLILHYRHFRSRFHSGLFPQYRVSFTPLSSKYLTNIATKENSEKMISSQILYDLINITDSLLAFPFDNPKKAPKDKNIYHLAKLSSNFSIIIGSVFAGEKVSKEIKPIQYKKSPFKYLKEDFDKACSTKLVKKLWNTKFINETSEKLNMALEKGRFEHPTDGTAVSTIIATGLFESVV